MRSLDSTTKQLQTRVRGNFAVVTERGRTKVRTTGGLIAVLTCFREKALEMYKRMSNREQLWSKREDNDAGSNHSSLTMLTEEGKMKFLEVEDVG